MRLVLPIMDGKIWAQASCEKKGAVSLAAPGMMLLQGQPWSWCSAAGMGAV